MPDTLMLPDCLECQHEGRFHGDRAVSPCAPATPPYIDDHGQLRWAAAHRCSCTGYRTTGEPRADN